MNMTSIDSYATKVREMILDDVRGGRVPATVRDFSELHDHLDANDYLDQAGVQWGDSGDTEADLADVIAVQDAVHAWLQSGGIVRELLDGADLDEWDEQPFVTAYLDGADSWTPDETTTPYGRDEIAENVARIVAERTA
jgi:hypothetical protein